MFEQETPPIWKRISFRLWGFPRTARELKAASVLFGVLRHQGWMESVRRMHSVTADGTPVPWFTYPAIFWLMNCLCGEENVFEYGSGNSTLWLSRHCANVVTVEHVPQYASTLRPLLPENAELLCIPCSGTEVTAPAGDSYVDAIESSNGGPFDMVIVDGVARNSCVEKSLDHLSEHGLILLDNSDRRIYEDAFHLLEEERFARLDFTGPVPGATSFSCTSIFSRSLDRWSSKTGTRPQTWMSHIDDPHGFHGQ